MDSRGGHTLNRACRQGFTGIGSINDQVTCYGTIGGSVNLNNGLILAGNGIASCESLTVNDSTSAISGGSLSGGSSNEYIGNRGTGGACTQSAGTSLHGWFGIRRVFLAVLYLGNNATDKEDLRSQRRAFAAPTECIGAYGTGVFNQTAGSNTTSNDYSGLRSFLGYDYGVGTYNLSGTGQVTATYGECVGKYGVGSFSRSGEPTLPVRLQSGKDCQ